MTQPNRVNKSSCSKLSLLQKTRIQSANSGNYDELRPFTANLLYSKKPFKKQKVKWNQSSSTWRHSTRTPSFSRDQRFKLPLPYSTDLLSLSLQLPVSNKACSFGSGKRTPISQVILKKARETPAPNSYFIQHLNQQTRTPQKGKSFCSPWNKYEKMYLNYRKDVYSSHFVLDNPPAKYDVRLQPDKSLISFSSYGKCKKLYHHAKISINNQQINNQEDYKFAKRSLYQQKPWVS